MKSTCIGKALYVQRRCKYRRDIHHDRAPNHAWLGDGKRASSSSNVLSTQKPLFAPCNAPYGWTSFLKWDRLETNSTRLNSDPPIDASVATDMVPCAAKMDNLRPNWACIPFLITGRPRGPSLVVQGASGAARERPDGPVRGSDGGTVLRTSAVVGLTPGGGVPQICD
jgi:hypothetical protein